MEVKIAITAYIIFISCILLIKTGDAPGLIDFDEHENFGAIFILIGLLSLIAAIVSSLIYVWRQ